MISVDDLDAAVRAGIVPRQQADRLVAFSRARAIGSTGADEEHFRLITGFNDIFVTIAIGLVLLAVGSLGGRLDPAIGAAGVGATSWALAEYFTRVRRMALPSIVLLLAFVAGVSAAVGAAADVTALTSRSDGRGWSVAALAAASGAAAAFAHWRRFHVPITVAAGAMAAVGTVLALVAYVADGASSTAFLVALALCGIGVFALAMRFDASDRDRLTQRSDIAFWLHLVAAPLIIHPVFTLTGLLSADPTSAAAGIGLLVYVALTVLALAIDRRALLVSALIYVIYAIQSLLGSGQGIAAGFGLTALIIGSFLITLSAAWSRIRAFVLARLPDGLMQVLPPAAGARLA